MAACLLVVLGDGLAAAASHLSMALGAFVAGLLLAETEYRREIESPSSRSGASRSGFISCRSAPGSIQPSSSRGRGLIIGLVAALVAAKCLTLLALGRAFRLPSPIAAETALARARAASSAS